MLKWGKNEGITLVALVITIIILLILAGITISTLGGENGLFGKVNQAKKMQMKAQMKETLILAIQELQLEKSGKATLDDITQEWLESTITEYTCTITEDGTIDGKKVTMKKDDEKGKFIIDKKLNVIEIESKDIEFTYEAKSREGNNVNIVITVEDNENKIKEIVVPSGNRITTNGKNEMQIDYTVELGKEYKFIIVTKEGEEIEEKILISDYYYNITKELSDGISIDNTAVKAAYNKPYKAKLTTGEEYILDTFEVTMGGQPVTVDITTGVIDIEKVTGDIVITATAKKLEIQYTAIAISTSSSASNTSSLGANTQTKGTTLYINIIATLEGTTCTATLKDDETKVVPYAVTTNGKYVFTVTGTYNGKTITEEKEVIVNQYQSAVGLVRYDAGEWTQEEIAQLKSLYNINTSKTYSSETGLNFTFGGFTYKEDTTNASYINDGTVITSRNQSVSPGSGYGTPNYDGWQILESEEKDGKTYVTKLVHAGSPENFVYCYSTVYDGYRAEYILSSGTRQPTYNTYQARSWDMYKDQNQLNLIEEVHAMTYGEALAITESESATDGMRNTGGWYWLGSSSGKNGLYEVTSDGQIRDVSHFCLGVRPVVTLKSGVYIVSGSGIEGDPYVLGI